MPINNGIFHDVMFGGKDGIAPSPLWEGSKSMGREGVTQDWK
jgi:hypothetical protein